MPMYVCATGADGRWTFTRYAGTFFAKVEGEVAVPLVGVEGFSRGRMQKLPDGTYLYNLEEAGYHTDLETGDVLDDWLNPLNNLTVKPRHYRSGQTSIFTPTSVLPQIDPWPNGLEYDGVVSPITVIGDSAWCSEDLFVKFPNPRERFDDEREWSGPYRIATSLATHSVSPHRPGRSRPAVCAIHSGLHHHQQLAAVDADGANPRRHQLAAERPQVRVTGRHWRRLAHAAGCRPIIPSWCDSDVSPVSSH